MDYHRNAPWTAVSRERLARLVIHDGLTLQSAAARFSVSTKTAAKWVLRYQQLGVAGLAGAVRDLTTAPAGQVPSWWKRLLLFASCATTVGASPENWV